MRTFVALACTIALALALPSHNADDVEWEQYKAKYEKTYNTNEDESVRRNNYFTAKAKVESHNALFQQGKKSYTLALNQFADMLPTEVAKMLNGYHRGNSRNGVAIPLNNSLPATVDWRKEGVVTPVKNQGQCGSCWAFSTTGALEGQWAMKKRNLVSLSEQNLVDCSGDQGNQGCNGGLMDNGFAYIKQYGIDTEDSYPYTAQDGDCQYDKSKVGATLVRWVDIESGSESALKTATANIGPIAVAIDASSQNFQLYASGVYDESDCSSYSLDHGVLVVGYGTDNGSPYWLVKNSWGASWGLEGYIQMSRDKDNQCGIATEASYPIV